MIDANLSTNVCMYHLFFDQRRRPIGTDLNFSNHDVVAIF